MTDLRQLHFRFRTDAGTADASPTWGAAEDVNYYPGTSNFRLRIGLRNASTVVVATPWELYVSRNGDTYTPVTTTIAKGVQSVDAGASADDTAVLIPRLYPFSNDWILAGAAIDLDFTGGKIYPTSAAFTDFLSITRASTGYAKTSDGRLTSFSTNQLRITDSGLLVEDARTNLALRSQELNTLWSTDAATITADQAVAPDGTTTMDLIDEGAVAGNRHIIYQLITSGATNTASVFLKDFDRRYAILNMQFTSGSPAGAAYACVDLQTGTITASGVSGTGTPTNLNSVIEAFANGVYRLQLTATRAVGTSQVYLILALSDSPTPSVDTSGNYAYNGSNKKIYAWGVQLEDATFASSYIPTTGASASRAADSIAISGAAQTTIAAATASIVAQTGNALATGFAANILDSNGTNILGFDATNHGLASLVATLATSNTANRSTTDDKLGLAWSGAGRSLVLNGATVVTDANAQTPSSTQTLGSANGTSNFIYSYVERLTLWNTKLADATLGSLTS